MSEIEKRRIKLSKKLVKKTLRTQNANKISVLENTKLGDKDQDIVVSVKRFGSRNVVFADEGYRGSSSRG